MTDWLYDTFIWTAVLIALVLVLRRPIARYFGPRVAYGLWALPFIRLIMPPVVLPAWMAASAPESQVSETAVALDPILAQALIQSGETQQVALQAEAGFLDPALLTTATLSVWLLGAAIFLGVRFRGYWQMRAEILADAREVGNANGVRLLESPKATAPLAFGVRDKIVALPPGFLATYEKDKRDLAVAHELAHHSGHDLLVNMIMQPLFALHWFNPLGHYGWQALRRDQEAACDARVIAQTPAEARQEYAHVIASFAAGPNVALAAPMACPVLGEKSIIERLRSLNMRNHTKRRSATGKILLAGALVALPLTATISYAETQSVEEAFADEAASPPAPPAPPAPPEAPGAPPPPVAPPAPEAPEPPEVDVEVMDDGSVRKTITITRKSDGTVEREERIHVAKAGKHLSDEEHHKMRIKVERELEESKQARAEAKEQVRIAMAEMGDIRAMTEAALAEALIEMENAEGQKTVIKLQCEGEEIATSEQIDDGTNVVMLCKSKVMAEALHGLKEARADIAQDSDMDGEMRAEVLRALDEQIKNWDKQG